MAFSNNAKMFPAKIKELPLRAKDLVLVKTNIGAYFFDAFLRVDHTSKLKVTEHPIESGSVVADHAYMEPREVVMEVGMSDSMTSLVPGQFTGGWSRSVTAYQLLLNLQQTRTPLFVYTRLGAYQNMLITAISVPDDYKTKNTLKASVTMRELLVASAKDVKVSAIPQTTNTNNNGQVLPQNSNESILYQLGIFNNGKNQESNSFSWPVPGMYKISSPFGMRVHPVSGVKKMHSGIDIPAPKGSPVIATKSGTVTTSGNVSGYGNTIIIDHGGGVSSLYGHNSELTVSKGQQVAQGQIVAKVGSTGVSTGNHCHFGIKSAGNWVDPQKYIK